MQGNHTKIVINCDGGKRDVKKNKMSNFVTDFEMRRTKWILLKNIL